MRRLLFALGGAMAGNAIGGITGLLMGESPRVALSAMTIGAIAALAIASVVAWRIERFRAAGREWHSGN